MFSYRLYIISGIILSLVIVVSAITLASNRTSFTSKAAQQGQISLLSGQNSYLFASPASAVADGESMIRLTVFIMDSQGLGVSGQKVKINLSAPVTIQDTQPLTDSFGRAIFDMTASDPGNYTISAEVSGVTLPQQVTVTFR